MERTGRVERGLGSKPKTPRSNLETLSWVDFLFLPFISS